jgi:hypothetical protein
VGWRSIGRSRPWWRYRSDHCGPARRRPINSIAVVSDAFPRRSSAIVLTASFTAVAGPLHSIRRCIRVIDTRLCRACASLTEDNGKDTVLPSKPWRAPDLGFRCRR